MKYAKWLVLVSLVCLIVVPVVHVGGCANKPMLFEYKIAKDDETISYLRIMQVWHDKWDELYWRARPDDPRFDELIDELLGIDPPRSMEYEHDGYVVAHQLFVEANRHLYNIEQTELKKWLEKGEMGYPYWSRERGEAYQIETLAFTVLSRVRARYEISYFWPLEGK